MRLVWVGQLVFIFILGGFLPQTSWAQGQEMLQKTGVKLSTPAPTGNAKIGSKVEGAFDAKRTLRATQVLTKGTPETVKEGTPKTPTVTVTAQPGGNEGRCKTDKECDDGKACTKDRCNTQTSQCENKPLENCCEKDSDCPATGDQCTVNSCDKQTRTCEIKKKSDGSSCNDRDQCTKGDICKGGQCGGVSEQPKSCYPFSSGTPGKGICKEGTTKCVDDSWTTCDGAVGPKDEVCNNKDDDCDGEIDEGLSRACSNACGNGKETCESGAWKNCSAPDLSADPGDECTPPGNTNECLTGVLACEGLNLQCKTTPKESGASCSDNDACTKGDQCDGNGVCSGTDLPATDLDDGNDCTADSCDSATGPTHTPVADNTSIADDGDKCTKDICLAGKEKHPALSDPTPDAAGPCQERQCSPNNGWGNTNKPDGVIDAGTLGGECSYDNDCDTQGTQQRTEKKCSTGALITTPITEDSPNCVQTGVTPHASDDSCQVNSCADNQVVSTQITACTGGDGCCPGGCNTSADTLDTDCPQFCGNGTIEGTEECDDGNQTDGDGCSPTCTNETLCPTLTCMPQDPVLDGDGKAQITCVASGGNITSATIGCGPDCQIDDTTDTTATFTVTGADTRNFTLDSVEGPGNPRTDCPGNVTITPIELIPECEVTCDHLSITPDGQVVCSVSYSYDTPTNTGKTKKSGGGSIVGGAYIQQQRLLTGGMEVNTQQSARYLAVTGYQKKGFQVEQSRGGAPQTYQLAAQQVAQVNSQITDAIPAATYSCHITLPDGTEVSVGDGASPNLNILASEYHELGTEGCFTVTCTVTDGNGVTTEEPCEQELCFSDCASSFTATEIEAGNDVGCSLDSAPNNVSCSYNFNDGPPTAPLEDTCSVPDEIINTTGVHTLNVDCEGIECTSTLTVKPKCENMLINGEAVPAGPFYSQEENTFELLVDAFGATSCTFMINGTAHEGTLDDEGQCTFTYTHPADSDTNISVTAVVEGNGQVADDCPAQTVPLTPSTCGNGDPEPGEECDDGNDDPADGCNACQPTSCGDGITRTDVTYENDTGYEECDDGGETENCTADCRLKICGDGAVNRTGEECDGETGCGAPGTSLQCLWEPNCSAVSVAGLDNGVSLSVPVSNANQVCYDDPNSDAPPVCSQTSLGTTNAQFDVFCDNNEPGTYVVYVERNDVESELTCGSFDLDCGPTCGNDEKEEGEECDFSDLNDPNYANCNTDTCTINPYCGDGEVNGDEDCEPPSTTISETLQCDESCHHVHITPEVPPEITTSCGDGVINGTEECDGTDLGSYTSCASLDAGFTGGEISCTEGCTIDRSGCTTDTDPCAQYADNEAKYACCQTYLATTPPDAKQKAYYDGAYTTNQEVNARSYYDTMESYGSRYGAVDSGLFGCCVEGLIDYELDGELDSETARNLKKTCDCKRNPYSTACLDCWAPQQATQLQMCMENEKYAIKKDMRATYKGELAKRAYKEKLPDRPTRFSVTQDVNRQQMIWQTQTWQNATQVLQTGTNLGAEQPVAVMQQYDVKQMKYRPTGARAAMDLCGCEEPQDLPKDDLSCDNRFLFLREVFGFACLDPQQVETLKLYGADIAYDEEVRIYTLTSQRYPKECDALKQRGAPNQKQALMKKKAARAEKGEVESMADEAQYEKTDCVTEIPECLCSPPPEDEPIVELTSTDPEPEPGPEEGDEPTPPDPPSIVQKEPEPAPKDPGTCICRTGARDIVCSNLDEPIFADKDCPWAPMFAPELDNPEDYTDLREAGEEYYRKGDFEATRTRIEPLAARMVPVWQKKFHNLKDKKKLPPIFAVEIPKDFKGKKEDLVAKVLSIEPDHLKLEEKTDPTTGKKKTKIFVNKPHPLPPPVKGKVKPKPPLAPPELDTKGSGLDDEAIEMVSFDDALAFTGDTVTPNEQLVVLPYNVPSVQGGGCSLVRQDTSQRTAWLLILLALLPLSLARRLRRLPIKGSNR